MQSTKTGPGLAKIMRLAKFTVLFALIIHVVTFIVSMKLTQSWVYLSEISKISVSIPDLVYMIMAHVVSCIIIR